MLARTFERIRTATALVAVAVALTACRTPERECFECGLTEEWARAEAERRERAQASHRPDALVVPESIDIQGHRGARGLRPEETLPSIEAALDLQVDTLEFDLHLSKDDKLVVWHDPHVGPDKCVTARRAVREMAAAELHSLRCDQNPDPERFSEQRPQRGLVAGNEWGIVTLGEVFEFVRIYANSQDKTVAQRQNALAVKFNIETKRHPDEPELIGDGFDGIAPATFEREFVRVVTEQGMLERVTLQSFDHRSLWAARKLEPGLRLAVLQRRTEPSDFDAWAKNGASIWSPDHRIVDAASIQAARSSGLKVIPWTINDTERMRELVDLGVDGIITDRPDLLRHE